jgi:hypothetical protein
MYPAIFSAAVAIVLFAATQVWTFLRARSDRLKQKHEDLMTALHSIRHVILPIPDHMPVGEQCAVSLNRSFEIINATSRPQILIRLYFKDAIPRFEELLEALTKATARFRAGAMDPGLAVLTTDDVKSLNDAIRELDTYLLENADYLTKEPFDWFRPSSW